MKSYYSIFIFLMFIISISTACNGGTANENASDSARTPAMDSMPVIAPNFHDTEAVITTPPTNDNNVIIPDSPKNLK